MNIKRYFALNIKFKVRQNIELSCSKPQVTNERQLFGHFPVIAYEIGSWASEIVKKVANSFICRFVPNRLILWIEIIPLRFTYRAGV